MDSKCNHTSGGCRYNFESINYETLAGYNIKVLILLLIDAIIIF